MIDYAAIGKQFEETFGFVRQDLARILTLEPGVNYAAAALIACTCEILAKYRYNNGGERVFKELLPPDRQDIGKSLYEALRNGLVHAYDAKDIRLNGTHIGLDLAWKETPHLKVCQREGKPRLVLNVRELCERLSRRIDDYQVALKSQPALRDLFWKKWNEDRVQDVKSPTEIRAWKDLIGK